MTDPAPLLPPNATPLERAVSRAGAERLAGIDVPLADLWQPATCPAELLPWLAWALSVDRWDSSWSEERKRAEIAVSIERHRHKGTRAAVDAVIDSFDELMYIVEWWETAPRGDPHTFDLVIPLERYADGPLAPDRILAIVREVVKVKPVRSHFQVVQSLPVSAGVSMYATARSAGHVQDRFDSYQDLDPVWATYLQTETGEPLEANGGGFLEDEPV